MATASDGGPLADVPLVAFAASTDLDRSGEFYGRTLGLAIVESSPFAVVFDAAGTTLRVTAVAEHTPPPFTVLGWAVPDIAATLAALAERDVAMTRYEGMGQDAAGVWTAPGGARVAWFKDPDGNTLSVTQNPG
jgi:catechol 2,3-dioxygenase-like lactoylglutathione lyase family enzyme